MTQRCQELHATTRYGRWSTCVLRVVGDVTRVREVRAK